MHLQKDNWQQDSWQKDSWQQDSWTVWFCLLLLVKALALVCVFSFLHPGLQADVAEVLYWAQELQWSGQKHPAMPAWLLRGFLFLFPATLPFYYVLGQITLVTTYIFVWLLAKEFLDPLPAVLATLVLACGLFYSFYSLTYNANTLSLASWAAFSFFLWKCLDDGRFRWWMALALAASVALLTKYAAALLFLAAGATLLALPRGREGLKTYKPYAAAALVVLLTLPHFWWVVGNDYATFTYATAQISQHQTAPFFPALYFPLRFAYGQVVNMLPVFLCFAVVVLGREKLSQPFRQSSRSSDEKKIFLLTMGLLPFGISIALSAFGQRYIHSLWGLFYWNLAGITLFYFFCRGTAKKQRMMRRLPVFFAVWASLVFLTTAGFLALPFVASPRQAWLFDGPYQVATKPVSEKRTIVDNLIGRTKPPRREEDANRFRVTMPPSLRPFFDGKFLALKVSEGWEKENSLPLLVVGGGEWLSANVSFLTPSRPAIVSLFGQRTAWLARNQDLWRERGGVLLWFARSREEGLPRRYRQALRNRPYALQTSFSVPWKKILGIEVKRVQGVPAPLIGWVVVPPLGEKGE